MSEAPCFIRQYLLATYIHSESGMPIIFIVNKTSGPAGMQKRIFPNGLRSRVDLIRIYRSTILETENPTAILNALDHLPDICQSQTWLQELNTWFETHVI